MPRASVRSAITKGRSECGTCPLCKTFSVDSAALLRRLGDRTWRTEGAVGPESPASVEAAATTADVSRELVLALRGPALNPHDRRVLASFGTHFAIVLERQELAQLAQSATVLEQCNRVRTALLAAVSHDLRTPLAGTKAAVSSLRSRDVEWSDPLVIEQLLAGGPRGRGQL